MWNVGDGPLEVRARRARRQRDDRGRPDRPPDRRHDPSQDRHAAPSSTPAMATTTGMSAASWSSSLVRYPVRRRPTPGRSPSAQDRLLPDRFAPRAGGRAAAAELADELQVQLPGLRQSRQHQDQVRHLGRLGRRIPAVLRPPGDRHHQRPDRHLPPVRDGQSGDDLAREGGQRDQQQLLVRHRPQPGSAARVLGDRRRPVRVRHATTTDRPSRCGTTRAPDLDGRRLAPVAARNCSR